jgi:hypothetical protein
VYLGAKVSGLGTQSGLLCKEILGLHVTGAFRYMMPMRQTYDVLKIHI